MKTGVFVVLMLLLSFATAFAGAMICCGVINATDEMFALGGIMGFLVPSVCLIAAGYRSSQR